MPYATKSLSQRKPRAKDRRPNAYRRGYTKRWERESGRYLAHHPMCVECSKIGRTEKATCVDHIIPHRGDKQLFWDVSNWQGLCEFHHNQKTGRGQ